MRPFMLMLGGAAALMLAACGDPADAPKPSELGPDTAAVENTMSAAGA